MRLNKYLREHKLTDAAFGAEVGLSQSYVNRLRRGEAKPSFDVLQRIFTVTRGQVEPDDFLTPPPKKRQAAALHRHPSKRGARK